MGQQLADIHFSYENWLRNPPVENGDPMIHRLSTIPLVQDFHFCRGDPGQKNLLWGHAINFCFKQKSPWAMGPGPIPNSGDFNSKSKNRPTQEDRLQAHRWQ